MKKLVKNSKYAPSQEEVGKWVSAGRPTGSIDKATGVHLRTAVLAAFDEAGGVDYLVDLARTHPRTFASLLVKILPTEAMMDIQASEGVDIPTVINIIDAEFKEMRGDEA